MLRNYCPLHVLAVEMLFQLKLVLFIVFAFPYKINNNNGQAFGLS